MGFIDGDEHIRTGIIDVPGIGRVRRNVITSKYSKTTIEYILPETVNIDVSIKSEIISFEERTYKSVMNSIKLNVANEA